MHRSLRLVSRRRRAPRPSVRRPRAQQPQLTIEIVGGAGTAIPIAIVPVRRRGRVSARRLRHRGRGPRALGHVQAGRHRRRHAAPGARRGRPGRRLARARRRCRRGRLDAAAGRRPRRGALRAGGRGQADDAGGDDLHGGARAVPRHGAQDRRRDLRKADRRPGRVLDAHRLHHQGGHRAISCWSPMPTAPTRRPSSRRTSRCCRRAGRRTARASPTCRSRARSRSSTCRTSRPARGRRWPTSAAATVRRRGRRTAAASR